MHWISIDYSLLTLLYAGQMSSININRMQKFESFYLANYISCVHCTMYTFLKKRSWSRNNILLLIFNGRERENEYEEKEKNINGGINYCPGSLRVLRNLLLRQNQT